MQDLIAGTSRRDECPALVAAFKACDKVFAELVVIIENVVDFQGKSWIRNEIRLE